MSGVPAAEKIVFMMISSGTASSAPVVPHTHAQKLSETRISERVDRQALADDHRRDEVGFDQVERR